MCASAWHSAWWPRSSLSESWSRGATSCCALPSRRGASLASGYSLRIANLRVGSGASRAVGRARRARRRSGPRPPTDRDTVLAARPVAREHAPLRLAGVDVTGAKVTIARFRDGKLQSRPAARRARPAAPGARQSRSDTLHAAHARGAQIELREPSAYDASAKDVLHTRRRRRRDSSTRPRSRTIAWTAPLRARRPAPFTIVGKIDAIEGTRCTARARRSSRCARWRTTSRIRRWCASSGAARNFDARLYALDVMPDVAPSYHVNLQLDVGGCAHRAASRWPADRRDSGPARSGRQRVFRARGPRAAGRHSDANRRRSLRSQRRRDRKPAAATGHLRARAISPSCAAPLRLRRTSLWPASSSLGVLVEGPIDDPLILASATAPKRAISHDSRSTACNAAVDLPRQRRRARAAARIVRRRGRRRARHDGNRRQLHSQFAVHVAGTARATCPTSTRCSAASRCCVDAAATGQRSALSRQRRRRHRRAARSRRGALRSRSQRHGARSRRSGCTPSAAISTADTCSTGRTARARSGRSRRPAHARAVDERVPRHRRCRSFRRSTGASRRSVAGGGSGKHVVIAGSVAAAARTSRACRSTDSCGVRRNA